MDTEVDERMVHCRFHQAGRFLAQANFADGKLARTFAADPEHPARVVDRLFVAFRHGALAVAPHLGAGQDAAVVRGARRQPRRTRFDFAVGIASQRSSDVRRPQARLDLVAERGSPSLADIVPEKIFSPGRESVTCGFVETGQLFHWGSSPMVEHRCGDFAGWSLRKDAFLNAVEGSVC